MMLLLKTSQVQKVQVYNARGNYESHGSYHLVQLVRKRTVVRYSSADFRDGYRGLSIV